MWIRNQLDVTLCYPLFLLYKLLNMFRATMCPSSGADDCVVLSPPVGIVLWLQEGCQNRLAGSVSVEEFVYFTALQAYEYLEVVQGNYLLKLYELRTPQWTHYLLLTGSDSLPAAMAQHQHVVITLRSHQLLKMGTWLPETCSANCKGEIKDTTKVTSIWFLIHTELRCMVNNTSDLLKTTLQKSEWCWAPINIHWKRYNICTAPNLIDSFTFNCTKQVSVVQLWTCLTVGRGLLTSWKTHSPAIQVDHTLRSSPKNTKSASAPNLRVPFVSWMPTACAGWRVAASKAVTTEHAANTWL